MYSPRELVAKRAFDIIVACGGLIALSPLLLTVACLVKSSSPGPIFFRQHRVGRHGRTFRLLKFRSMRVGSGPLITASGDVRVTRVGRLLRKSKLDELPGLLNVVRGDLSLVGPRPEVAKYVALYPEAEREFVQQFRPGITDPATIYFRNEEELLGGSQDPERTYAEEVLPKKLRLSGDYLRRASFLSDLKLLAVTVGVIVAPRLAAR